MRNILVPKLFGFAKIFGFSLFPPPASVHYLSYVTKRHQDLMTSLASLKTLNHFKTFMILNKLGSFYLVSLWQVLMFAARGLSRN